MDKDFEITPLHFSKPELKIEFLRIKLFKRTVFYNKSRLEYYSIIFIEKGDFEVTHSGKSQKLSDGDIFVAMPFERFDITGAKLEDFQYISVVLFHQDLFANAEEGEDFLRALNKRKKGEFNHYKKEELQKFFDYNQIFKYFRLGISKNFETEYFVSGVKSLIFLLNIIYDEKQKTPSAKYSPEYEVQVWDYILNNCLKSTVAKDIQKQFAISKWYLDKVTMRFYGSTYYQTVKSLRMWHSRRLIRKGVSFQEISIMCGYNNYSSFYKCYCDFFGISPKKDYNYFLKHKVFYSDKLKKNKE